MVGMGTLTHRAIIEAVAAEAARPRRVLMEFTQEAVMVVTGWICRKFLALRLVTMVGLVGAERVESGLVELPEGLAVVGVERTRLMMLPAIAEWQTPVAVAGLLQTQNLAATEAQES